MQSTCGLYISYICFLEKSTENGTDGTYGPTTSTPVQSTAEAPGSLISVREAADRDRADTVNGVGIRGIYSIITVHIVTLECFSRFQHLNLFHGQVFV